MPGVISFISHSDIHGANNFIPQGTEEKIFYQVGDTSGFAGTPVGLILAESSELAHKAAKAVKITCTDTKKPKLNIKQCITEDRSAEDVIYFEGIRPKARFEKMSAFKCMRVTIFKLDIHPHTLKRKCQ